MQQYNARFYAVLSSLMGVKIEVSESDSLQTRVLFKHFNTTVDSYTSQVNPYSKYLEAGLLHKAIDSLGEKGRLIRNSEEELMECAKSIVILHLNYLEALFIGIWGKVDTRVTLEELLVQGFDPRDLPDIDW